MHTISPLLAPLKAVVAGRSSGERIQWTDSLLTAFDRCKKALNDIKMVHTPKPSDVLHTYSDFFQSRESCWREIRDPPDSWRKSEKTARRAFFMWSIKNPGKRDPWECEALPTKLVLEHFADQKSEQKIHHSSYWQPTNSPSIETKQKGSFLTISKNFNILSW